MNNKVEKAKAIFWKSENGIIHVKHLPNTHVNLEDSIEKLQFIQELNGGPNALVVSDPNAVASISKEAKDLINTDLAQKTFKGLGIITTGYFTKYIFNFMIRLKTTSMSIKTFRNRSEAEHWLLRL